MPLGLATFHTEMTGLRFWLHFRFHSPANVFSGRHQVVGFLLPKYLTHIEFLVPSFGLAIDVRSLFALQVSEIRKLQNNKTFDKCFKTKIIFLLIRTLA